MKTRTIQWAAVAAFSTGLCLAQFWREGGPGGGRRWSPPDDGPIVYTEGGVPVNEETVRTARETAPHVMTTPNWTNAAGFERDVFTFVRIIFKSSRGNWGFRAGAMGWLNDYPDSDLNLSYRLHQLTSMKVDPDGRVLKLTDPALADYPFIYIVKPGRIQWREEELPVLRQYLLNGGALMADDFWGTRDWQNFEREMKRVLPGRTWTELTIDHPLFHCVYDLRGPMNNLQAPSIHFWNRNYNPADLQSRASNYRGEGSEDMRVRAWLDDKQRIMVIATFNTDNGDGWEREADNESYFRQFSETRAYPLAINILVYLMTH